MKYLLDTNACIRYINGRAPRLREMVLASSIDDLFVCAVVKAEMYYCAAKSQNPARSWHKQQEFLAQFASLPFDDKAAVAYATIRANLEARGALIGPNDLMIAAIAVANDLTLVTNNTGEFSRVEGLKFVDWESAEGR